MSYLATGIVYTEKAQLDLLATQLANAQYEVNQQQANVTALTNKSAQFTAFLAQADTNKQTALANLNMAKDIDANINSLSASTQLANSQSNKACAATTLISHEMANLINKLIFSVEIIDKFGQLVNKQKTSNPLIPDSLISLIAKTSTDSNNAIALTLTALQSCYAAQATSLSAQQVVTLQNKQVTELKTQFEYPPDSAAQAVTQTMAQAAAQGSTPAFDTGLFKLSQDAYQTFEHQYQQALLDNSMVSTQLAYAQQMLAIATTSLNSYQAGLAAATAAAYAA